MAEPQAPPLTDDEIERLIAAFEDWAEHHPFPDYPAFAFGAAPSFSPRELVYDLRARGPIGERVLRMVQFATEDVPLEEILAQLRETRGMTA